MKILITGGAGFIGSHLSERLIAEGHSVTVLDDLSTGRRENLVSLAGNNRFRLVVGTILDPALVQSLVDEAEVVFHLAAAVGVKLTDVDEVPALMAKAWLADGVTEVPLTPSVPDTPPV